MAKRSKHSQVGIIVMAIIVLGVTVYLLMNQGLPSAGEAISIKTCYDQDGGMPNVGPYPSDIFEPSQTWKSTGSSSDYCIDSVTLKEYSCNSAGAISGRTVKCPGIPGTPGICEARRCIFPAPRTCSDSDGYYTPADPHWGDPLYSANPQLVYQTKGTVTFTGAGLTGTFTDYCVNANGITSGGVMEHTCFITTSHSDPGQHSFTVSCPNGCIDGACQ